jgi:hypothetical protein
MSQNPSSHPVISISYNRFLDPIFIGWIKSQPQWKDWEAPPIEDVRASVIRYKKEWERVAPMVLAGICRATGLSFVRNHIDVFVVSGNPRPFSRPIVIKSRYTNEEFLCVLAHELIHCLFSDNRVTEDRKDPYPENMHILVHALLWHVYIDVLGEPKLLETNRRTSAAADYSEYSEAWRRVEEIGYGEVIRKFREMGR